jgi:hypothetical protein
LGLVNHGRIQRPTDVISSSAEKIRNQVLLNDRFQSSLRVYLHLPRERLVSDLRLQIEIANHCILFPEC